MRLSRTLPPVKFSRDLLISISFSLARREPTFDVVKRGLCLTKSLLDGSELGLDGGKFVDLGLKRLEMLGSALARCYATRRADDVSSSPPSPDTGIIIWPKRP